jgi:hypothetical protein
MAERKNYHTLRYGNADGDISFGHIHEDNNLSAVMLRSGQEELHYITLDSTGEDHRKDGTICRSLGSFQVKAGDRVGKGKPGVYIDAVSGDLVLRAPNGRVRIEGINIDLIASGPNGKNGVIRLESNEKVLIKTKIFDANASVSAKIFSDGTVNVIGKTICDIYGGLVDIADGFTEIKGSKGGSANEDKNRSIL